MVLGNGGMYSVASRNPPILKHNFLTALNCPLIDGEDLVHDGKECVESKLDGIAAINGNITMQNLLQNLGIRHEALTIPHQLFN